ncbi:MAG: hypothetical protein R3A12_15085 [Ignavibacteria bacterium]
MEEKKTDEVSNTPNPHSTLSTMTENNSSTEKINHLQKPNHQRKKNLTARLMKKRLRSLQQLINLFQHMNPINQKLTKKL